MRVVKVLGEVEVQRFQPAAPGSRFLGKYVSTPTPALTNPKKPLVVAELKPAGNGGDMTGAKTLYTVTHKASGMQLGAYESFAAAKRAMKKCEPLTDWTQSVEVITKMSEVGSIVAKIKRDEGAVR